MLGKLIKHEMLQMGRTARPMFIALAAIALVTRILYFCLGINPSNMESYHGSGILMMIVGLFSFLTVIACLIAILAVFLLVLQRFYKNMFGDEGYLSHTLPVTPAQHLLAKAITGLSLMVTVFLLDFAVLMLFGLVNFRESAAIIVQAQQQFADKALPLFLILPVFLLCIFVKEFFMAYAAMSIGSLKPHSRLGTSIGAYVALYTVEQIIGILCILAAFFGIGLDQIEATLNGYADIKPFAFSTALLVIIAGISVLWSVVYFLVSKYLLTKKLNLA